MAEREPKASIVKGGAKSVKRGFLQKIAEYYLPDDIQNIPEHIMYTFFIPAIFDAVCDSLTNGVEMIFHGGSGKASSKRRKFDDPLGYQKVSSGKGGKMRINDERDERISGVDIFIPGNITEVDDFLGTLDEDIDDFDYISVSDVYQRAGIKMNWAKQGAAEKYGWTSVEDVTYKSSYQFVEEDGRKVRVRGYILHFPKPTIQR